VTAKTKVSKADRERVQKLIDVFLDHFTSPTNDAGWHGWHLMGALAEYEGDLPRVTGNDRSNDAALKAMSYLRTEHALLPEAIQMLAAVQAKNVNYSNALIVQGWLQRIYKRRHSDKEVARFMSVNVVTYRGWKARGKELAARVIVGLALTGKGDQDAGVCSKQAS